MNTSKITLGLILILTPILAKSWELAGKTFQFESVADKVYVMHGPLSNPNPENRGFMNNPGFIETEKGLVLIDPGSTLEVGNQVLREVSRVSNKPIIAVFNTHIHGDHWLANQAVRNAFPSAKVYAHPNMIRQANDSQGLNWLDLMHSLTEGASEGTHIVAPDSPVTHGDIITIGGETFKIHHLGISHTDTDIIVEHADSGTVFLGDNCLNQRLARFDGSGSILGTIETLRYISEQQFSVFVPGHGPSGSYTQVLTPFLAYLEKLESEVSLGFENDQEDYEIKEEILSNFTEMHGWSGFNEQFGPNVNKMYLEIEAREM